MGGSSGDTSGGSQGGAPSFPGEVEIDFSEIIEQGGDENAYDDSIAATTATTDSELQGLIDELGDPADFGVSTTLATTLGDVIDIGGCSDFVLDAFGHPVTLSCADGQVMRDWLGWIARFIFLIAMFQLVTNRPQ